MILGYLRSLAARFLRRRQTEADLEEELSSHVQLRADELERLGLTRVEAERRARIEFGGHERVKEECREAIAGNFLDILMQDLRFSLRTLAKQPVFAVVAIVTLAIGIGMSTVMLSIVHDVLIRPLPYANSKQLYSIYARSDSMGQTRVPFHRRGFGGVLCSRPSGDEDGSDGRPPLRVARAREKRSRLSVIRAETSNQTLGRSSAAEIVDTCWMFDGISAAWRPACERANTVLMIRSA
jgi:hypothetical protein